MRLVSLFLFLFGAGTSLSGQTTPAESDVKFLPVGTTVKAAANRAIDNPSGSYRVQLKGDLVSKIRNAIGKPSARIIVTVRQVHGYPEASCARLAYTFGVAKSSGLQLDGPPVFTQEMDICKNGLPPPSTLTPAKIEQLKKIRESESSRAG